MGLRVRIEFILGYSMAGFCKYGIKTSGFHKDRVFLHRLSKYQGNPYFMRSILD
jgi:hypothetical protein